MQNWENFLLSAINWRSDQRYVVLRSLNLVALGLFIFVRSDAILAIRNVQTSQVKTGLGGMAANKGGIGVSLNFYDTSLLFITAHFAAGSSAVADRNQDYHTITSGLVYKAKAINDHEYIFNIHLIVLFFGLVISTID